ncbi:MAG: ABC transporter ATP-binding protein, partial [Planctomycetes bacterium]|nr:ABC transporter ATP-binding protein [Planctomycetota bacterium]
DTGTALVWITHDLTVVAGLAQRIAVMYAGRIVETGPVDDVLDHPIHPYTQGLLGSLPSAGTPGQPLAQIPGSTPSLGRLPPGCAFAPRCGHAGERCAREAPATTGFGGGREARWPSSPTQRINSPRSLSVALRPETVSGRPMFSATLRWSRNWQSWCTTPMRRRTMAMSSRPRPRA